MCFQNYHTKNKRKKARSRLYSAEIITHTDYADDLALVRNTPVRAECLL